MRSSRRCSTVTPTRPGAPTSPVWSGRGLKVERMVFSLMGSPEYADGQIDTGYRSVLLRDADAGGRAYWRTKVAARRSRGPVRRAGRLAGIPAVRLRPACERDVHAAVAERLLHPRRRRDRDRSSCQPQGKRASGERLRQAHRPDATQPQRRLQPGLDTDRAGARHRPREIGFCRPSTSSTSTVPTHPSSCSTPTPARRSRRGPSSTCTTPTPTPPSSRCSCTRCTTSPTVTTTSWLSAD